MSDLHERNLLAAATFLTALGSLYGYFDGPKNIAIITIALVMFAWIVACLLLIKDMRFLLAGMTACLAIIAGAVVHVYWLAIALLLLSYICMLQWERGCVPPDEKGT